MHQAIMVKVMHPKTRLFCLRAYWARITGSHAYTSAPSRASKLVARIKKLFQFVHAVVMLGVFLRDDMRLFVEA